MGLNHLTRRKNAQGAIDYSFSVSLAHQDLGIDEAAKKHQVSCFQNILELPEKLIKHNA